MKNHKHISNNDDVLHRYSAVPWTKINELDFVKRPDYLTPGQYFTVRHWALKIIDKTWQRIIRTSQREEGMIDTMMKMKGTRECHFVLRRQHSFFNIIGQQQRRRRIPNTQKWSPSIQRLYEYRCLITNWIKSLHKAVATCDWCRCPHPQLTEKARERGGRPTIERRTVGRGAKFQTYWPRSRVRNTLLRRSW